ncbi:unnamed protein product [Bemisia tabaci]|uniref:SLC26A/SulP transporter domain-containing protein n=1 Tax=Bemisia tabaci TaxID=7038 RepID=A0A9P0CFL2_BEMTA|nr:unnamed protein product [Bemisia tabaci]
MIWVTRKIKETLRQDHGSRLKKCLFRLVPLLETLQNYTRFDFISDMIAGTTVGLTMLPQSIAYAALAGLTPQCGLNSAFVGVFVYLFFGTTREVFIGPSSLMAILTYEYTKDLTNDHVILLTFICGCVELAMSLLRLGFLVELISVPVSSGFTAATSIIIVVSQLKGLLGISYKASNFLDNFVQIAQRLPQAHYGDVLVGVTGCVSLLFLRKLKDFSSVNKKSKIVSKIFWFLSTGRNALIVLIFSSIAHYYKTTTNKVPFTLSKGANGGLPRLELPPFETHMNNRTIPLKEMVQDLGAGVFIIPIVSVLANISIAKAFANGGMVRATQEMFTLGICNIANSLFQAMPSCGAFTRSAVASASGIRTSVANLYSGAVVMLGLHFLSPYFQYIPRSTLSAVLICACIFLIETDLVPLLWKENKMNLFTFLITIALSLCFGVEIGLLIGVVCDACYLLYLWARPDMVLEFQDTVTNPYILVRPNMGFFFPAVNYVYSTVNKIAITKGQSRFPFVFDCVNFKRADYTAVKGLVLLSKDFQRRGQELYFINVSNSIVSFCATLKSPLKCFRDRTEMELTICGAKMDPINKTEVTVINEVANEKDNSDKDEFETLMLSKL